MDLLVTNDDGYESPGLHALADRLAVDHAVTVVAPLEDHSSMGRVRSDEFEIHRRKRGYAVAGTPVDCVIAAVSALDLAPDAIVAGCNIGGNLGAHTLGRSATIGAVIEGTFLDLPGIAVSLCVPEEKWPMKPNSVDFEVGAEAAAFLVEHLETAVGSDPPGYLNVNLPISTHSSPPMVLTRPSGRYPLTTRRSGDRVTVSDRSWEEFGTAPPDEPMDTDRGAVQRGFVSVSALLRTHGVRSTPDLRTALSRFDP